MNRRELLRSALAAGALYGAGGLPRLGAMAYGTGFAAVNHRVLANLMLLGGPDMRHLFPPAFDANPASFGFRFWQAKAAAHGVGTSPAAWQARWENDYLPAAQGATRFGIHAGCGWLDRMWNSGKLAIVSNVFGSTSRDHAHSIRVMEQGDRRLGPNEPLRSGWGGRLAVAAGGNALALTPSPRSFTFGPAAGDPSQIDNRALIAAADTRAMTLAQVPADDPLGFQGRITRSLEAYYAAKRHEIDSRSPYHQITELERVLREFGEPLEERLSTTPVPEPVQNLIEGGLAEPGFGLQIRNLYDALAAQDILALRTASLAYGGWDSHRGQVEMIEPKLVDLFGVGKAFDTLYAELPQDAADRLVIVIAGEFGRQLRANGDGGTDHGVGTSVLVIGNAVRGGVYGDMFPEEELGRLSDPSPDIRGQTHIDHVFGAVADWVAPGGGSVAFPERSTAILEAAVNLNGLMTG